MSITRCCILESNGLSNVLCHAKRIFIIYFFLICSIVIAISFGCDEGLRRVHGDSKYGTGNGNA